LISGESEGLIVRKAGLTDLDAIKNLTEAHRHELGFVRRPALVESIQRKEVFVAENGAGIVGFLEYHHRRDNQTTLYHIAVRADHRKRGIGTALIDALTREAAQRHKTFIQIRCPADLPANSFYERVGCSQEGVQPGKKRDLIVWRLSLGSVAYKSR